jgi:hypothetical protein
MNAPHPTAFRTELTLTQMRKSWYMFFFEVFKYTLSQKGKNL